MGSGLVCAALIHHVVHRSAGDSQESHACVDVTPVQSDGQCKPIGNLNSKIAGITAGEYDQDLPNEKPRLSAGPSTWVAENDPNLD
jgi:hypothetical protein